MLICMECHNADKKFFTPDSQLNANLYLKIFIFDHFHEMPPRR